MAILLEYFINERFKMLELLSNNQIEIKGCSYINLSQQEIADMAHVSKLKANKIINELIDLGCLALHDNKRGKYLITKKGFDVLRLIKETNI